MLRTTFHGVLLPSVLTVSGLFLVAPSPLPLAAGDERPGEGAAPAAEAPDAPAAPAADGRPAGDGFLRLRRDASGEPVALETSIARYAVPREDGAPAAGEALEVDLIGVVHVADAAYYRRLDGELAGYDAVLYELVAPSGKRVPPPPGSGARREDSFVGLLQKTMTSLLGLESQLDHIDYTRENFVHADLSPEGMAEAARKRGDDAVTIALGIAADLLREANRRRLADEEDAGTRADRDLAQSLEELDPIRLLLDPTAGVDLKRALAAEFGSAAGRPAVLGRTLDTLLIADRNAAAVRVLQKELARGKKRIAIFYGAAHMPDFEKRLRDGFGLVLEGRRWLTAWDLRRPAGKPLLLELLE